MRKSIDLLLLCTAFLLLFLLGFVAVCCAQSKDTTYQSGEVFYHGVTEGCPCTSKGSEVTYHIPKGKYTSKVNQEQADSLAMMDYIRNGQLYVNGKGYCIPIKKKLVRFAILRIEVAVSKLLPDKK